MWIYEVKCPIPAQMPTQAHANCEVASGFAQGLASDSKNYLQQRNIDAYTFLLEIQATTLIIGVLSRNAALTTAQLAELFGQCGLRTESLSVTEITLKNLVRMLGYAERKGYIEDKDVVLQEFNLDKLMERGNLSFSETVFEERTKEALYREAESILADETMLPELERIYIGKQQPEFQGHPVHYLLQADEVKMHTQLYGILLGALYANDRIRNKRCCILTVSAETRYDRNVLNDLYRSCEGGTIILRFPTEEESEECDYASVKRTTEMIGLLCALIRRYHNRVLTVLCFPRSCEAVKSSIYSALKDITFVKLRENIYDEERARSFLEAVAKKAQVHPDARLLSMVESGKSYLGSELTAMYAGWYDSKLKATAYPQYELIQKALARTPGSASRESGSAYDRLQELVGLTQAKAVIDKALNYFKMQQLYIDRGIRQQRPAMHMSFAGNPGTAKTTVARLFARIMRDNGLLSEGQLVEVGRSDLVGKYIGWTAKAVQSCFEKARGGVLFIDEAYSLVDDRDGSFGDEAINTIVQEMENHREDMVVIFAGYSDKMEGFLRKNPGLRSRIAFHVPFADYDAGELCQIAELMSRQMSLQLTPGAMQKLEAVFAAARMQPDFGNGRYVRNVIENAAMNQAARILQSDYESMTNDVFCSVCAEDIEQPQQTAAPVRSIGFSA